MNDQVVITEEPTYVVVGSSGETVTVPDRIVEVVSVGIQGPPGAAGNADATTTTKGVIKLAGDLSGTADLPTVPALSAKADKTITVNGQAISSNVTLTKSDVGLSNVDNTSDATKNAASATLTNKTMSGSSNTFSNIPESAVTNLSSDLSSLTTSLAAKVSGPSSATDNAIARFDGTTGKLIKNSGITIDDSAIGIASIIAPDDTILSLSGGTPSPGSDGQGFQIRATNAGSSAHDGGGVTITAGDSGSGATGNGGNTIIYGGYSVSTNGNGGDVVLSPGGETGSGIPGVVRIENPDSNTLSAARLSAVNISADRDIDFPDKSGTLALTSDRTPRIGQIVSSASPTINADDYDQYDVTALAVDATFAATGTPADGQELIVRVKDDGTPRLLAFNSAFRFSTDLPAPTTTVISKTIYMKFKYNSADAKWDLLAWLSNF